MKKQFCVLQTTPCNTNHRLPYKNMSALLLLILLFLISSCSRNDGEFIPPTQNTPEFVNDISKININAIHPSALQYYKDIASVMTYYYEHPEARTHSATIARTMGVEDTTNTFLEKADNLKIIDSGDIQKNVFELSKVAFDTLIYSMVVLQSYEMSEKFNDDTTGQIAAGIDSMNKTFAEANPNFGGRAMTSGRIVTARTFHKDPYWACRKWIQEKQKATTPPTSINPTARTSESDFWYTAILNGILSYSVVSFQPASLTPQTFLDRIRGTMAKGRLLVSLPGGYNTWSPIVFYPNADWYDVGHVGILNRNYPGQLASNERNNYDSKVQMDIGANKLKDVSGYIDGVQREPIGYAWCQKHGISHVGQIFDRVWYIEWHWIFPVPHVKSEDINNDNFFNRTTAYNGRGYCAWYSLLFAKWSAPDNFICSTLPWYAAKQSADVNIGDWWKPTIFPAGVYLSDRVRIIDNTLY